MASEHKQHRFAARLWRVLLGVAIFLLLAVIALTAWLFGTQSGAQIMLSHAANASSGTVKIEGIHGRLAGPLAIGRVLFANGQQRVTLTNVQLDWLPRALLHGELHVTSLHVAQVLVSHQMQQNPESPHLPARIALPFALQVDHAQIDASEIGWGPLNIVNLGSVAFQLDFDRARYRLRLAQLDAHSTVGTSGTLSTNLNGQVTLAVARPYALEAELSSNGAVVLQHQTVHLKSRIDISGTLEQLQATLTLSANEAQARGHVLLRPFAENSLVDAELNARDFDIAVLRSTLPHTMLDLGLSITHGIGRVSLTNRDAGSYSDGKLPVTDLRAGFRQNAGTLGISNLFARLGTPKQQAGTLNGGGQYEKGALNLHLDVKSVDLKQLDRRMQATELSGQIDIAHVAGKQEFTVALSEPFGEKRIALRAHASVADDRFAIERADIALGSGNLSASGQMELTGQNAFRATGSMRHFQLKELGRFDSVPDIELNGNFSLHGARQPKLVADMAFDLNGSRFAGHALQGEGQVQLQADRLLVPKLALAVGANRLQANGELSGGAAQLLFALDAPDLAQLGSGMSGNLQVHGSAHGSFEEPHIDVAWTGTQLQLPGQLQVEKMNGKSALVAGRNQPFHIKTLSLDASANGFAAAGTQLDELKARLNFSPQANAPLAINVEGNNLHASQLQIDRFSVTAQGTTGRHAITTTLSAPGQEWALGADGGLRNLDTAASWQGRITRLDGSGDVAGHLVAAAPFSVSKQEMQLDHFAFDANAGHIAIEHFLRGQKRIATRGNFDRLELMPFFELARQQPALSSDLQLAGDWNLDLADTVNGSINVHRQRGDIVMKGSAPVALGLQAFDANMQASNGHLSLRLNADGNQVGHIGVNADARLGSGTERFSIQPDAPISGAAKVDIPSLGWAGPFISPSLITGGRLQSAVSLSGTWKSPRLSGTLAANELRLLLIEQGVDLRHGMLQGEFHNDELLVKELRFQSVDGDAVVSGPVTWSEGKTSARLELNAEHFVLFNRIDRRLSVSGQSRIDWDDNNMQTGMPAGGMRSRIKIGGAFHVDSGFFDLGKGDTPQLSDDVVITGRAQKKASRTISDIDVKVALGDGIKLQGRGLDATLAGELHIVSSAAGTLQGEGTLNISKGTYSAYGHKLAIEKGALLFHGPLANPALDILAMQRGQEVETGVAVSGTVQSPRITLVSEPSVPDTEKLSWLVLGHGLDTAGSSDLGVLQAAASALLSKSGSGGMRSQLANAFGLDEINVTTDQNNAQQRVVTLGKRISSKLEVGYEQGIESASSVLHLRYTLSKHLSLEGETGTRSAISVLFNFLID